MKKSLVLAAMAMVLAGSAASAHVVVPAGQRPLGYCAIQARLTMNSGALGIAVSHGEGFGRVVCKYRDGSQEIMPILVETTAVGIGLQLPETMSGKLYAPGFGVTDAGAVGLLGTYGVIRATGGVGRANGEIGLGLTVNETGFVIPAILQLDSGFHLLTATLNLGELTLRFDPQNLQARFARELPVVNPRRPHHHQPKRSAKSAGHHHHHQQHQQKPAEEGLVAPRPPHRPKGLGHQTPLPPTRPSDLGQTQSSGAVDGADLQAQPGAVVAPAPAVPMAPVDVEAEPVTREI